MSISYPWITKQLSTPIDNPCIHNYEPKSIAHSVQLLAVTNILLLCCAEKLTGVDHFSVLLTLSWSCLCFPAITNLPNVNHHVEFVRIRSLSYFCFSPTIDHICTLIRLWFYDYCLLTRSAIGDNVYRWGNLLGSNEVTTSSISYNQCTWIYGVQIGRWQPP